MTVAIDSSLTSGTSVDARLLHAAYARKPLNMWLSIAVAPVGMLLAWPHFPSMAIAAWGLAVILTSVLGLLESRAFQRAAPGPKSLAIWRRLFVGSWMLSGLAWALGPTLLLWQSTGPSVAILVAILFAVTTAFIVSVAEIRTATACTVIVTLVPPALSAWLAPVAGQQIVGLVLLVAILPLLGIAHISSQNIRQQIEAQFNLQRILDNAQDAVIGLDNAALVTGWNRRAERLFGWQREEVLGKPLDQDLLRARGAEPGQPILLSLLAAQANSPLGRFEMQAQHKSGSWFAAEIAVIQSGEGKQKTFTAFVADISQRKEAEGKLALFRKVFDASSQCVVITDAKGHGLYQNLAHEKALGYSDEELAGEFFTRAFPPETAQATETLIKTSVVETGSWNDILIFRRKDGSQFTSRSSIGSIVDANGQIQYVFNIFTDITDILAGREALRVAKEDAENANRAKSDFLSNMSHELRTPLNAILGFAQMLEMDNKLGVAHKDNVKEIVRGGRHLLHLVDEVLDLSEIEAGKVTLALESVRYSDVIDEAWSLVAPLALAQKVTLHKDVSRQMVVRANRTRLKQVALNLLSNGIKYNRQGGEIAVRTLYSDAETVRLEVTDTGVGIAADRIEDVFQAFIRLGDPEGLTEGTGIGLNISKQLVEMMAGRIGVISQLAVGSTFWVELPLGTPDATDSFDGAQKVLPSQQATPRSQCVLCIDDNPVNLKLIGQILVKRPAIELVTAPTPGLGIQLALSRQPDLILLDINMPGMDGYQVLEVLKNYERTKYIPVIAVTANATPRDIELGGAVGLADYLTKPLNIKKFLATIDLWLAKEAAAPSA